jgi:aspartate 1-decarboxylase
MNGPAAGLIAVGDHIVIMAYAYFPESLTNNGQPKELLMDENNQVKE